MVILVAQLIELPRPCHRRTDHGHVVPSIAAQRLGRLLQPGVVDKCAIVDRGIRTERNFKRVSIGSGLRRQSPKLGTDLFYGRCAAYNKAIMNRGPPESLKVS